MEFCCYTLIPTRQLKTRGSDFRKKMTRIECVLLSSNAINININFADAIFNPSPRRILKKLSNSLSSEKKSRNRLPRRLTCTATGTARSRNFDWICLRPKHSTEPLFNLGSTFFPVCSGPWEIEPCTWSSIVGLVLGYYRTFQADQLI